MNLSRLNYPASFKMLRSDLLSKAIEIGNTLLNEGYGEQVAEMIALSNAKLWNFSSVERSNLEQYVHLVPHPQGWALISQDASKIHFVESSIKDALPMARKFAKNDKTRLYFHSMNGTIKDYESFVVNRPAQPLKEKDLSQSATSNSSSDGWLNKLKENLFNEEGRMKGSFSI